MNNVFSYYPLLIISLLFLIFSNCEMVNNPPADLLSFEDIVCGSASKIAKVSANDDFLYNWQLDGNKLKLDFRFDPVCGSAYAERVISENNTIHIFYSNDVITENNLINIFLDDTASIHARCICEHQSIFRFSIEDVENIRLILDIKFYTSDEYTTCVDTLLQLY